MTEPVHMTACNAGCGAKAETELLVDGKVASWEYLPITGRYRCGDCRRALQAASAMQGAPHDPGSDPLPRDSLGALKRFPEAPALKEGVR
jgi:hypothetical protein